RRARRHGGHVRPAAARRGRAGVGGPGLRLVLDPFGAGMTAALPPGPASGSPAEPMPAPLAETTGLMTGLVDDAGLFPPTSLAMADALARHRRDQAAGSPVLTHRFLCPASRITELRSGLRAD